MKRTKIFFTLLFLFISTIALSQNLGDRLKQRVLDRAESKIEQKADAAVDRVFDRNSKSKTNDEDDSEDNFNSFNSSKWLNKIMGGAGDCTPKSSYSFTGFMDMETTVTSKDEEPQNIKMRLLLDKNQKLYGIEYTDVASNESVGAMTMIVDMEDSATIMSMDVGGQKLFICQNAAEQFRDDTDDESGDASFDGWVKTGKTKIILGYTAYQYIQKEGETESEMWIVTEGKDLKTLSEAMKKNKSQTWFGAGYNNLGLILEMKHSNSETVMVMKVTSINLNSAKTIRT